MVIYYEPERSLEPPEELCSIWPVCGSECGAYVRDWFGNAIGCDTCTERLDAWDELDDEDYGCGIKPSCPVCGYDCGEYVTQNDRVIGCEHCVDQVDAWKDAEAWK